MKQKITHYQTLSLYKVLEIGGDLLLLPEQKALPHEEVRALRGGQTIAIGESLLVEATERLDPLFNEYVAVRKRTGEEPDWLPEKPFSVQAELRNRYVCTEEEALSIVFEYKHTGLSYMVREGGLIHDLHRLFNMERLRGVKQLGFLQAPWFAETMYSSPVGEHNRLLHSTDVMAIASVIGHNLGLPESEFNTLRTAAYTHDVGTPAGGDSVKLVDMDAFDEDANYPELLARLEYQPVFEKYGIDKEALFATIMNEGLLGQILDIADKLAYVARDLWACLPYLEYGRKHLDQHGLHSLFNIVERFPNVCGLWDAVECIDGQAVITDEVRLAAFLKTRTLLFRELYYHPNARFGEYLVSRMLVKALYDSGRLTRDQLLNMRDYELDTILDREYGDGRHFTRNVIAGVAESGVERINCYSREEARATLARLRAEGRRFSIVEDNSRQIIKTGEHLLVATPEGPKPFREACPGPAQELREIAMTFPTIYVYYLTGDPPIPEDKLAELAEAFGATSF